MNPLKIGIIGYGKIAADQHVPSIALYDRFELAATVSRAGKGAPGLPCFADHKAMIEAVPDLDAVAITTPPGPRYPIARDCIESGLHCMLEKPPTVTLGEIEDLACLAEGRQVTLQTTWHAQANPAVAAAAQLLAGQRIANMRITWREDVRKWHPGQQWIWAPGGFGVFDPGINALSIVAKLFPGPLFVKDAELSFPANRNTPIAADIAFASPVASGEMRGVFDWRHSGGEAWTIEIETEAGQKVTIGDGGSRLEVDGAQRAVEGAGEYAALYAAFLDLIDERRSLVDVRPLRLVADAFTLARRREVEAFED
jgi:D-galactose 1-dehydrogenase